MRQTTYQICDKTSPGSFERKRRSRALSPDIACSVPVADLKSCSNFAWSSAVIKESLTFGILPDDELVAFCAVVAGAGDDLNEFAICADVMPVG